MLLENLLCVQFVGKSIFSLRFLGASIPAQGVYQTKEKKTDNTSLSVGLLRNLNNRTSDQLVSNGVIG